MALYVYICVCHSHKLANGSVRLRQVSKQDYRSWHRHVRIFCQLKSQQSSPSQHLHTRQLLSASTGLCVHSPSPKSSVYTYCVSRPISIKTLSFCSSAICWVMAAIVLLNPWCLTKPCSLLLDKGPTWDRCYVENTPAEHTHKRSWRFIFRKVH